MMMLVTRGGSVTGNGSVISSLSRGAATSASGKLSGSMSWWILSRRKQLMEANSVLGSGTLEDRSEDESEMLDTTSNFAWK